VWNIPRLCGPLGYIYVVTSSLNILYFTWFVPIISLVAGILLSVIYNWPIPQVVDRVEDGAAGLDSQAEAGAGDQRAGDRAEGTQAGGVGAVLHEIQLRDVGESASTSGGHREA
jgi:hypothetical protein